MNTAAGSSLGLDGAARFCTGLGCLSSRTWVRPIAARRSSAGSDMLVGVRLKRMSKFVKNGRLVTSLTTSPLDFLV